MVLQVVKQPFQKRSLVVCTIMTTSLPSLIEAKPISLTIMLKEPGSYIIQMSIIKVLKL